MKRAPAADAPYQVPRDSRRWPALALAAAMHAGLLFFLWVGVNWQSSVPVAVEAEVWDMKVQSAAPPAPPAETEPEPEPEPEPAPAPAPQPAPPPEAVAEPLPPPKPAPDIALERRKARLKLEREQQAAEELKRKEELKREELKREQKELAEKARLAKEKADKAKVKAQAEAKAEAKAKAEAEAEKQAKADKELAARKAASDKLAKAKHEAADKKAADDARRLEMSRITGAVGNGSGGTAAKSTAPKSDSGYAAAVTGKIKGNLAYSGSTDVEGNPRAIFKIQQLPTGEIISVRKVKGSGIAAYDSAVENAINKSSPLPKKKDGTVDREVEAEFILKDTH